MSGKDRRPHETAITLDQSLLDFCQDNLDNKLQLIVEIERPQEEELRFSTILNLGSPGICTSQYNPFVEGQTIIFEGGSLPSEVIAGDIYYVRNPLNGNFNISSSLLGSLIDFTSSGIGDASATPGIIRISDRNIFVGNRFYEARTTIPTIKRTVGEWLRPEIEFSSVEIPAINNIDQKYSGMLPGGSNYSGQINKEISIKLGLRDVESTYFTIFNGFVSETGGFGRTISGIKYIARDKFDRLNIEFPTEVFNRTEYPKISEDIIGLAKPIIYGDFTNNVETEGNIPAQIVNKSDPQIFKDKELPISIANGSPCIITLENHYFDDDDKIRFTTDGTLPTPLSTGVDYYVVYIDINSFSVASSPGGLGITTSGGSGQHNIIAQDLVNIQLVISNNVNSEFQTNEVWLVRSEIFYKLSALDIINISGDLNYFEISQDSGNTLIDGNNLIFESNDIFLVKVKGKNLSGYDDNLISQAMDILINNTYLTSSDFDSNWLTYRDKATPTQSAIANIKSRVWIQEKISVLQYALSMLEQVRLEFFISKDLKLKINSLHLEDFNSNPSHILRNYDVIEDSLNVSIDEKNNFNRVQGFFDFNPYLKENNKATGIFRNQASIDQSNKEISKAIEFPNLYIMSDIENQIIEFLRISSVTLEILDLEVTSRQILLDIGDFVKVNISIDSIIYDNIPMLIREISYNSDLRLPIKLWSFQMLPFDGWNPGYNGIVGGSTATIIEET